ncbi:uncharacterized protein TM35_000033160 [Trypanosoma theileri]|uniref:Uncharacterized protein n=1 Tax=Trypanosoma theileri TaxID=67003 RepID=A0A1X0P7G7_9TRYP|nr:uncharacterized protein TM35_000033160 [Trypanosoma theileri]ORC92563.1 hypothetical protein TM35_000033160 [Trypanosoma theileri]
MLERRHYSTSAGVAPSQSRQPQRRPFSAERGRSQPMGAQTTTTTTTGKTTMVTPSPLYSQRSQSARSRGSLSGGRPTGNITGERRAGRNAGVLFPTERRVSFMDGELEEEGISCEEGRSRGAFLYTVPSPSNVSRNHNKNHSSNNNNNNSNGNGNPVRHLLSELVEISQTLASYLQDASMLTKEVVPHNIDGLATSQQQQQQQHATLKAQEIERIVRRVECHFVEKITAMERKEKEQASEIADLKKEIRRLSQGEGRTVSSHHLLNNKATGYQVPYLSDEKQEEIYRGSSNSISNSINNTGDSEIEFLRRTLQEEKRQRLFVEEQTQSLTEQHGRVVRTLERRLQKQEDQLRELIASLEHQQNQQQQQQQQFPFVSSPNIQSSSLTGLTTPRRLLRQQLAQHEQTHRALEAYRHSVGGLKNKNVQERNGSTADGKSEIMNGTNDSKEKKYNNNSDNIDGDNNDDDDDIFFAELGLVNTKSIPDEIDRPRGTSHTTPHLSPTNLHPFPNRSPRDQQHSVDSVPHVVDATVARAAVEIDDIAAFLDNITQELESIDAIESEREKKLSGGIKGL